MLRRCSSAASTVDGQNHYQQQQRERRRVPQETSSPQSPLPCRRTYPSEQPTSKRAKAAHEALKSRRRRSSSKSRLIVRTSSSSSSFAHHHHHHHHNLFSSSSSSPPPPPQLNPYQRSLSTKTTAPPPTTSQHHLHRFLTLLPLLLLLLLLHLSVPSTDCLLLLNTAGTFNCSFFILLFSIKSPCSVLPAPRSPGHTAFFLPPFLHICTRGAINRWEKEKTTIEIEIAIAIAIDSGAPGFPSRGFLPPSLPTTLTEILYCSLIFLPLLLCLSDSSFLRFSSFHY